MKNQSAGVAQLGNWYAVAAVAAASFGLTAGAHQADAAPVIVHPVGGPVTAPPTTASSAGGIVFNVLDTTGTKFETVPPAIGSPGSLNVAIAWLHSAGDHDRLAYFAGRSTVASVLVHGAASPASHYATKLGGNAVINSSVFGVGSRGRNEALAGESVSSTRIGSWQPGDTGFIGLAVFTSASLPLFGWAEIHLGSNFDPTLIAWGYNSTPGAPDVTPSLPEPSSLLLLASGAAGLAAYRRRRAQRLSRAG